MVSEVGRVVMDIMGAKDSGATILVLEGMEGAGMALVAVVNGKRNIPHFDNELRATERPGVFRVEAIVMQSQALF